MGTISQFTDSIREVAKPKLFDVQINIPLGLSNYFIKKRNSLVGVDKTLSLRCESTNIPGRTFATTEQKFGSNPTEKHAYHTTYNDIDMTFIVTESHNGNTFSSKLPEKQFFDEWMNLINPTTTYDFLYKEDYVGSIFINQLDTSNEEIFQVKLIDAFPISVNQLDLDWSSDGYHKLNVTFAYTRWQ
jgi:hypothetical protein